jgi:hypothetical protein
MMQATGIYTVGGLMMLLFLSACAAKGGSASEGPTPTVQDNLAPESVPATFDAMRANDDIPVAG